MHLPALQHPHLLDTAAALPHAPGFPRLGVLRRLRPVPGRSAVGALSPAGLQAAGGKGSTRTVPVFTVIRSTKEEPDCAPAASLRVRRSLSPQPPRQHVRTASGVPRPVMKGQVRAAPGPDPPGSSRCRIKGPSRIGSSRTPLHPARRTQAIWQYWPVPALSGLLPPSPAPPGPGCPQLHQPAAAGQRRRSFTSTRIISASRRTPWP